MSDSAFDFKGLADQVRDELLADPFFSTIPALSGTQVVISEDPHDIVTAINAALNNIGLGVLVLLPVAHVKDPNLPGPYFDPVEVTIKVYENPTINRSASINGGNNPTCYAAAMQICADLHQWLADGVDEGFIVRECVPVADDEYIIYQMTISTQAGLQGEKPELEPVMADVVAPGNQAVRLSCGTPGASIWYTLDGTTPAPRNPSAKMVYVQSSGLLTNENGVVLLNEDGEPLLNADGPLNFPIQVSAGQLLRARPWLSGYGAANPPELTNQY
ncbi:MAG: chitobiase/beta-hexosaminidase C-terminal domain-containing protein [Methylacidiphilales bacterium]|nr:chitobiase/beta-hexosaminidase C-terminal domain-containing protein [Candidatus Methylacidiphilales bacterium]